VLTVVSLCAVSDLTLIAVGMLALGASLALTAR
jgi:arginine exporter protein ArgO